MTREALRQDLSPAHTFVDFEQGINAAVKRLREALRDSAATPQSVQNRTPVLLAFLVELPSVEARGKGGCPIRSVVSRHLTMVTSPARSGRRTQETSVELIARASLRWSA